LIRVSSSSSLITSDEDVVNLALAQRRQHKWAPDFYPLSPTHPYLRRFSCALREGGLATFHSSVAIRYVVGNNATRRLAIIYTFFNAWHRRIHASIAIISLGTAAALLTLHRFQATSLVVARALIPRL